MQNYIIFGVLQNFLRVFLSQGMFFSRMQEKSVLILTLMLPLIKISIDAT